MSQEKTSVKTVGRRIGGKKILIAGAVALFCLAAVGVWKGGLLDHRGAPHTHLPEFTSTEPTYVETPEIVANLDAGPHRIAFAKLQCRIALDRASDAGTITASMPRIVDAAQAYLHVLRPEELRSGTGAYLLREALIGRVAAIAPSTSLQDVLFEEFIVQ